MVWDTNFFYAFYNLAGQSAFWDGVVFWSNKISIPVFVAILFWYLIRHRRIFWFSAAAAFLARGVFVPLIHFFYFRGRPFVELAGVKALANQNPSESSFPSGHAAFFFTVAFAVYLFNRPAGVMLMVLALFFGLGRVYLGLHYPADVAVSAVIAAFSVLLIYWWRKQKSEG